MEEARPRVRGLGAVDAVELGRVADRLVHLELHLLGVDDHGRRPRRDTRLARSSAAACSATRGASRSSPSPSTYSQPACALDADVRARVAAHLEQAVAGRHRVDPAAALDVLLVDLRAVRGEEELALAQGADQRLRDLHVRVAERLLGAQAERDLVRERDRERIALDRRAVRAGAGLERRERPRGRPARRGREGAGAQRGVAARLRGRAGRSQAKPQAPPTSTRTPIPSLSESVRVSTRPFFVPTDCDRRTTARASAYAAPAPSAASTPAAHASRKASGR